MDLTSKEWYELGYEMGEVENSIVRLMFTLQSKYGKSNKYTKLLFSLYNRPLCGLKSNLDDLVCSAYPNSVHTLPNYENINLTSVFYHINRCSGEEYNSFGRRIRPLPKSLSSNEMIDLSASIQSIGIYISKVNKLFFNSKNKHVNTIEKALTELSDFYKSMIKDSSDNKSKNQ